MDKQFYELNERFQQMQNILLDLRILKYGEEDDDTEKTGFLPMMINVDQDELKSEDFSKIITNVLLVLFNLLQCYI